MKIVGAEPGGHPVGLDKQAGVSSYFVGNDRSKWHTNIANFARAGYQNVYPGINLAYHGDPRQLEYDFVVEPGASPGTIRLAFGGALGKSLDAQGNLVLHASGGDVVEHAPAGYQVVNGVRHPVASRFVLGRGGRVGFEVGQYDHGRALVIDPVLSLSYSTYLGGTNDKAYAIAVDGSGNAYVTGNTTSNVFPTLNPFQAGKKGGNLIGDAFVTKFNSAGSALVYSTYLAGKSGAGGFGIAVDSAGNAYATGNAGGSDFPQKNQIQPGYGGGGAFLTELDPTGSKLRYSTIIPGAGAESVAVDGSGNAYVAGWTTSTSLLTTPGAFQTAPAGSFNADVVKINPKLVGAASLVYSTYLGGSTYYSASDNRGVNYGYGIAVDKSGHAYVTGSTDSTNFPTTAGAFQSTHASDGDFVGFMTEFNSTGSALVYSTYLGGPSALDFAQGSGIAVDGSGDAYVIGVAGPDFPTTTGAFGTTSSGVDEAFVAKMDPSRAGSASLVYSTYLGGANDGFSTYPFGIAVDRSGNAYVAGHTDSTDFPTLNPVQATYGGGSCDTFVTKLNPTGTALVYSTFLGGFTADIGTSIAVDASGDAYVAGATDSSNFPTTAGAFQPTKPYGTAAINVFVTELTFN